MPDCVACSAAARLAASCSSTSNGELGFESLAAAAVAGETPYFLFGSDLSQPLTSGSQTSSRC